MHTVKHMSLLRLATECTGVVTTFLVFVLRSLRCRTFRRVVLGDLANQHTVCWPTLPFPFWAGLFMTVFAAWHSHLTPVVRNDGSFVRSHAAHSCLLSDAMFQVGSGRDPRFLPRFSD